MKQNRHPHSTSLVGGCSLHNKPKQHTIILCTSDYAQLIAAFTEFVKTTRGEKYKQAYAFAKYLDKCATFPTTTTVAIRHRKEGGEHKKTWQRFMKWARMVPPKGGDTTSTKSTIKKNNRKNQKEAGWKKVSRKKSVRSKLYSAKKVAIIPASPNQ